MERRPSPQEAEYDPALRAVERMIEIARRVLREAQTPETEREAYLMEQDWMERREDYLRNYYGLRRNPNRTTPTVDGGGSKRAMPNEIDGERPEVRRGEFEVSGSVAGIPGSDNGEDIT